MKKSNKYIVPYKFWLKTTKVKTSNIQNNSLTRDLSEDEAWTTVKETTGWIQL